jgi:hypothetical protein
MSKSARERYRILIKQGVPPGRAAIESGLAESERLGKQHYTTFAPDDEEDEDEEYRPSRESDMPDYREGGRFSGAIQTDDEEDDFDMEMGEPTVKPARKRKPIQPSKVTTEVIDIETKPKIKGGSLGKVSKDMDDEMRMAMRESDMEKDPGGQILKSIAEDVVQSRRTDRIKDKIPEIGREVMNSDFVREGLLGPVGSRVVDIIKDRFDPRAWSAKADSDDIERKATGTWQDLKDSVNYLAEDESARTKMENYSGPEAGRARKLIDTADERMRTMGKGWLMSDEAKQIESELLDIFNEIEMEEAEQQDAEARRERQRQINRQNR